MPRLTAVVPVLDEDPMALPVKALDPAIAFYQSASASASFVATIIPAAASALIVSIAGGIMQAVYPGASSIGMVWRAATNPHTSKQ